MGTDDLRASELRAWSDSLAQDIAKLRSELHRCQAALTQAEEKQALVHRLLQLDELPSDSAGPSSNGVAEPSPSSTPSRLDGAEKLGSLEESVAVILDEAHQPLHVSDIRARLISNGVRIPGKGDDANIIVRLRKDPERFTRTARGTYALAAWGLPSLETAKRGRKRGSTKR